MVLSHVGLIVPLILEPNRSSLMDNFLRDVRFALRALARRPGATCVAIATLALGIGANAVLFGVFRSVVLEPLPYSEPDRVMTLWSSWVGTEKTWMSEPEFLDYRDGSTSLGAAGVHTAPAGVNLTEDGRPERVMAIRASAGVFEALGTSPLLGRGFTAEEDAPGSDGVAVIAYGLWQRRYGGDPNVIGTPIRQDGQVRTIVGVMPPDFRLPIDYQSRTPADLWIPLAIDETAPRGRGGHYLYGVARLTPGIALEQAKLELDRITAGWVQEGLVDPEAEFSPVIVPVADEVLGSLRPMFALLIGAVGLVLLIACANVANLRMASSESRRREIALRAAIGAGPRRILSQSLTESMVLSLLGGMCGVGLAAGGMALIARVQTGNVPRLGDARLDGTLLVFAFLLALGSGIVFGVGPATIVARTPIERELREGGRSGTSGPGVNRFRRSMIVIQVALAMVLVVGAGLMIRAVASLYDVDLGFRTENVLTASLSLPVAEYPGPDEVTRFIANLEERLAMVPGVTEVGSTRLLPLTGTIGDWTVLPEGRDPERDFGQADWQVVTPGYVEAMGMTVVRGRTISDADRIDASPVVMVNESLAERFWPGMDALGGRLIIGNPANPPFTVIGILRGVRHNAIVEEERIEMYIPHQQFSLVNGTAPREMTLAIRTSGDPLALTELVREQVRSMDPNLPVAQLSSLDFVVKQALREPRFAMLIFSGFGLLALVLAAVGIYGLIACSVAERRKEMGIRMALGAGSRRILGMVVGEGLRLTLLGIAMGMAAAAFLTLPMRAIVYGVSPHDPITYLFVPVLLVGVAVFAAWLPAWRATRVDPIVALHE